MYLDCKGIKIYYEIYGEGFPVFMIHGWGVDHNLMKGSLEPVFSCKNFKRIYFDLPGMGKSSSEKWINSSDIMLEIVIDFLDQIIPEGHFLLAGESYGGYLSLGLLRYKREYIDGLFLLCPLLVPGYRKGNLAESYPVEKDEVLINELTDDEKSQFEYITIRQNRDVWEKFNKDILTGLLKADQDFLQNTLTGDFSFSIDDYLVSWDKPSLILTGRQDGEVGYVDQFNFLEKLPRASYAVLDMAGHNLQIEQVDIFNAFVEDWLLRSRGSLVKRKK